MLDKYLEIQAREQEKVASRDHFVERMMLLPNEELFELQRTGEIKLAYYSDLVSSDPDHKTWLDHFKGTHLYAQAIALEEEDLKMQAADDQADQLESQERATKRQARDALRLEKRLLELELVKSEQAAESAALPPPEPSPGMGAPPMGVQGAGAPGGDAEIGKMAAVLRAKIADAVNPRADKSPSPGRGKAFLETMGDMVDPAMRQGGLLGGLAGAVHGGMTGQGVLDRVGKALGHGAMGAGLGALAGGATVGATSAPGAAMGAGTGSKLLGTVGGGGAGYALGKMLQGRLGSNDPLVQMALMGVPLVGAAAGGVAGHSAAARAAPGIEDRAKRDLGAAANMGRIDTHFEHQEAKGKKKSKKKEAGVGDFLRAAAPAVGNFVKKHPGAAIGGGIGALHGLMRQDGGVGSAVLEGAGGAALGHGAEHLYRSGALSGIKDAVMPATGSVAKEAAALPPFGGEKNAGHSPEKVFKALRGASKERVRAFGNKGAFRRGFHDVMARDSHIRSSYAKDHGEWAKHHQDSTHHMRMSHAGDTHERLSNHELSKREGRTQGHLHGAAAAAATGGAGYLAGKHDKEKRAFIGAMLGALGGAAARGGASGLMSGGLKGLGGAAMNWAKSNPMKAVGGAMNAASNFASARQQGQGLGGAALSGLAGGASALG